MPLVGLERERSSVSSETSPVGIAWVFVLAALYPAFATRVGLSQALLGGSIAYRLYVVKSLKFWMEKQYV